MYSDRRVIHLLQEICVAEANGEVRFFDRKLGNRRFCACAVKIGLKLAYCVVKSPKFLPLYGQSQSLNTTVFKPDKNLILSANCNKTANINLKSLAV